MIVHKSYIDEGDGWSKEGISIQLTSKEAQRLLNELHYLRTELDETTKILFNKLSNVIDNKDNDKEVLFK
jgi:hypothetical protein